MIRPDQPLPESPDMERFVLGAILTSERQPIPLEVLLGTLTDADFTKGSYKLVFSIAHDMARNGKHVDLPTIFNELLARGKEKEISISELSSLAADMPSLYSLNAYVEILREKTRLRSLIAGLEDIQTRAFLGEDSAAILSDLGRFGEKVANSLTGNQALKDTEGIVEEVGGVEELMRPRRERGIATPLAWLNEKLSGFAPKALTLLAARPSVGKSALALQFAMHAAERKQRTLFYSLEMASPDLIRRMVSQRARVNMHRIRLGHADDDERGKAAGALYELIEFGDHLLISDRANGTIPEIVQSLQNLRSRQRPADFLVVDYLQLMNPIGRFSNRNEEISSLSRGLKLIAQMFDIPVLALSQLSRESEKQDREPRLSDLRDSGSLEQDADNVIFLHRRGMIEDNPNQVRLILSKNRGGQVGRCDLHFFKNHVRFEETTDETEAA